MFNVLCQKSPEHSTLNRASQSGASLRKLLARRCAGLGASKLAFKTFRQAVLGGLLGLLESFSETHSPQRRVEYHVGKEPHPICPNRRC